MNSSVLSLWWKPSSVDRFAPRSDGCCCCCGCCGGGVGLLRMETGCPPEKEERLMGSMSMDDLRWCCCGCDVPGVALWGLAG